MTIHQQPHVTDREAHFTGGGIASLAGAAFLVRDGNMPGENIHIYEKLDVVGGAMDGAGDPDEGYVIRGGRMFNFPTYECTWDLFRTIPSLEDPSRSVKAEMDEFNEVHESCAETRLMDGSTRIDASNYGLTGRHRRSIVKLLLTPEERLGDARIEEWFADDFFETNFWYVWATIFAFQPWHSVAEVRRYMYRFLHEFPRLHTMEGVDRTRYNQYDSMILPLRRWLEDRGVSFEYGHEVVDMDIVTSRAGRTVTQIHCETDSGTETIPVEPSDLVFVTNGSMTDGSSLGAMDEAPELNETGASWELWKSIADGNPQFGNPSVFADNVTETKWESFTVTLHNTDLFDHIVEFTDEEPGNGLVTYLGSNWLLSTVVAAQPHFANQPDDVKIFWGYGLFPDREGNYVEKPMSECTGREILQELCYHLEYEDRLPELLEGVNCIPAMMPFITAHFQPREPGDRPAVVPDGSNNLAFLGQYSEVDRDVVFTVEYSVRSAMVAVYDLLDLDEDVPSVSKHYRKPGVLTNAIEAAYR
ncbi:oleate hydratase [Haloarchaeobius sp. FL176]|uniref:oleate hydratase n=1 Tax=Haloarchaeobius sp. FL176 TaxID=2967129 RepID=UPI002147275E|nr:oleate hydratase [Haloarchaeobius sp. FL176]